MYATIQPNTIHHLANLDKAINNNDVSMIDNTLNRLSTIKPALINSLSTVLEVAKDQPEEARKALASIRKLNAKPSKVQQQATLELTPSDIANIVSCVRAGQTAAGICKTFHISHDTLRKIKAANGLPLKKLHKKRTFTDAQLLATYKATGNDIRQTAIALNVDRRTAKKRLDLIQ